MKINVLDKGYVRLVSSSGGDLAIVNAARVSYDKESESLTNADIKLINFLVANKHDSPLRHATATFEVYAPLLIARQWWKHAVGSTHTEDQQGWNESSRRYVTEKPEYYIPQTWRSKPDNNKQGSGPVLEGYPAEQVSEWYDDLIDYTDYMYHRAMDIGVAPEQARLFLPAYAMYVRWRWTASVNAVFNFLDLRLEKSAQDEITQYANAVSDLMHKVAPVSMAAWKAYR